MVLHPHHDHDTPMVSAGPVVSIAGRIWDAGLPRYRRWRDARRIENRIAVFLELCDARIEALDKGEVSFNVHIANFSPKPIVVDHVEIDQWRLGANYLSTQSSFIKASGGALREATGRGYFSLTLQSSDIRAIAHGIQPASNSKSSPQANLEMRGVIVFSAGSRSYRVRLSFEGRAACIQVPHSMA